MTTFQGPPQSRRAARENERAAMHTDPGTDYSPFAPQGSADSAEAARPVPGGRRAQREQSAPTTGSEPLTYATQIPSYDGPSFGHNAQRETSTEGQPAYRVRDFSPEGRRSSGQVAAQPDSAPPSPTDLDYHTHASPLPDQPSASAAPSVATPSHQPMTRRELRAMQAKADAEAQAATLIEPEQSHASVTALSNAIAEFEALTRANQRPALIAPEPEPEATEAVPPVAAAPAPALVNPQQPAAPSELPVLDMDAIPDAAEATPFPFALQSSSRSYDVTTTDDQAPASFSEPVAVSRSEEELPAWARETEPGAPSRIVAPAASVVELTPEFVEPAEPDSDSDSDFVEPPVVRESYTPPVGHWTRQAELDDDELPFENTLSREVGGGTIATTTSALILPSIPQQDFSGIVNGTGEILITGTIDLPHSLGSTGGDSRHLDNPEVDHMFDAFDKELVSNDSQPVRAIRAVSTHTATRGAVQINTKPHSNRLLTAGIITACVLAAAVVALLGVYVVNSMGS